MSESPQAIREKAAQIKWRELIHYLSEWRDAYTVKRGDTHNMLGHVLAKMGELDRKFDRPVRLNTRKRKAKSRG